MKKLSLRAVTLIELLTVIAIIGILAGVSFATYQHTNEHNRDKRSLEFAQSILGAARESVIQHPTSISGPRDNSDWLSDWKDYLTSYLSSVKDETPTSPILTMGTGANKNEIFFGIDNGLKKIYVRNANGDVQSIDWNGQVENFESTFVVPQTPVTPGGDACSTPADCDDHNACNGTETCSGTPKICHAGTALTCTNLSPDPNCQVANCNPDTGCELLNRSSTTACNFDSNACTTNDHCSLGHCVAGSALECTDTDHNNCTSAGCNPLTGCQTEPVTNGTACEQSAYCFAGNCFSCRFAHDGEYDYGCNTVQFSETTPDHCAIVPFENGHACYAYDEPGTCQSGTCVPPPDQCATMSDGDVCNEHGAFCYHSHCYSCGDQTDSGYASCAGPATYSAGDPRHCIFPMMPEGTQCSSGYEWGEGQCDQNGQCQPPPDQCASMSDGDVCDEHGAFCYHSHCYQCGDSTDSGYASCAGAPTYSADDPRHCIFPMLTDGTQCSGGDGWEGQCQSGTCTNVCDDHDPCTLDSSTGGSSCTHTPLADGATPDGCNSFCMGIQSCQGGACHAQHDIGFMNGIQKCDGNDDGECWDGYCQTEQQMADCNDGNDCTTDDFTGNGCLNAPINEGGACSNAYRNGSSHNPGTCSSGICTCGQAGCCVKVGQFWSCPV